MLAADLALAVHEVQARGVVQLQLGERTVRPGVRQTEHLADVAGSGPPVLHVHDRVVQLDTHRLSWGAGLQCAWASLCTAKPVPVKPSRQPRRGRRGRPAGPGDVLGAASDSRVDGGVHGCLRAGTAHVLDSSVSAQAPSTVILIRAERFIPNPATAADNAFQRDVPEGSPATRRRPRPWPRWTPSPRPSETRG